MTAIRRASSLGGGPPVLEVRFVSGNRHKLREASQILRKYRIRVIETATRIEELQTVDNHKLVRDKLLKAYELFGRPLFVEHTGLYLDQIGGLPGGLTQIFWDTLKAGRFAELFGRRSAITTVTAKTTIAWC